MGRDRPADRRTFIKTTSGAIAAGFIAGCLGDGDDTDDAAADDTDDAADHADDTDDAVTDDTDDTADHTDDIPRDSELYWGQTVAPVLFDPVDPQVVAEQEVYNLMFTPILNYDEGTTPVPHLAKEIPEPQEGGTQYVLELREEAMFQNGEPVTAEDVKYSLEAPLMYDTPAASGVEMLSEINVIDDHTVEVNLDEPYAPVLHSFADYQVVPKEIHEEDPEAFGVDVERTIGSGPYELVSFEEGESATIRRWDDYWGPVEPYLEEIHYQPIDEDTTRVTALETDQVDGFTDVPPQLWDTVEQSPETQVYDVASLSVYYAHFNMNSGPTVDREVRHAIDYCLDQEAAIESFVEPAGEPVHAPIPQELARGWDLPYDDWVDMWHDRDIDEATALFEEAGVPDDYQFTIIVPPDDIRENIAVSISNGIQEAGYDAEVQRLDWGALIETRDSGDHERWDMILVGLLQGPDPDLYLWRLIHEQAPVMFWDGPGSDEMYQQIEDARTSTDDDERQSLYEEIITTAIDERLQIQLYSLSNSAGVHDRVQDFGIHPNGSINPPLFRQRLEMSGLEGRNVWVDRE